MKSLTFWLLLVGLLVTWRVMAGLNDDPPASRIVLSGEFDVYVLHSPKPVLVTFTADWCGSCKKIDPVITRIASKVDGKAIFYEVDVDKHPEVADRFGVSSIPTLLIFDEGKVAERIHTAEESAILKRLFSYIEE
jgi:thioredoxin 1